MTAEFNDIQDEDNPFNGRLIKTEMELGDALHEMQTREPSFCELKHKSGFCLKLGISHDLGCAQYSTCEGSPPYWMALANGNVHGGYVEFFAGGTPTPVPMRYCLPIDIIRQIAIDFLKSGSRSESNKWEDI